MVAWHAEQLFVLKSVEKTAGTSKLAGSGTLCEISAPDQQVWIDLIDSRYQSFNHLSLLGSEMRVRYVKKGMSFRHRSVG